MDEVRKRAYREMLASAVTHVRACLGPCKSPHDEKVFVDCAYIIVETMHNLAAFSARDFDGFDEDWHWRIAAEAAKFHPRLRSIGDREAFERRCAGEGAPPEPPPDAPRRRVFATFDVIQGGRAR